MPLARVYQPFAGAPYKPFLQQALKQAYDAVQDIPRTGFVHYREHTEL